MTCHGKANAISTPSPITIYSGWWLSHPSEKYNIIILVSWDDDIPNIWKNNPNVPNHHPVFVAHFPKVSHPTAIQLGGYGYGRATKGM